MVRRLTRWLDRMERAELLACAGLAASVLLASVVPLGLSLAVTPAEIESGRVQLTPPCPHRARYGTECITCGMTRALTAIGHGQLQTATRYHRAGLFLYGATLLAAATSAASLFAVSRRLAFAAGYATARRRQRTMPLDQSANSTQQATPAAPPAAGTHR